MAIDILAMAIALIVIFVAAYPVGRYMARVFRGERTFLSPVIGPVERLIYRLIGVNPNDEQTWKGYIVATMIVTLVSIVFTYVILRTQANVPLQSLLNPASLPNVPPALAMNTAVSFATNTNWQNYAGEATMSYLSQMVALVFHQFLSAATGIALAMALVRGLVRRSASTLGNFYVDVTRCTLYVLLPIAGIAALFLVSQGAIQNLAGNTVAHTLSGVTQTIAQGPAAAMTAIEVLGTNGGGFFNANGAHPFENPTGLTNAFEMFLLLLLPFALPFTFGDMVGKMRQGVAIFAAMAIILVAGMGIASWAEQSGNPAINSNTAVTTAASATQAGGNMEGKEARFGPIQSATSNVAATGTSTGWVDSATDSYTPLGGLVPLVMIQLGEITPGGVGSGLYGMLVFAILAVFIAGLMVGRTPEYLGKKIESREIKLAGLAILALPFSILFLTAISVLTTAGQAGPLNAGPHGFTEILYAFSSVTGNNGSAMAGLTGNTPYYNVMLVIGMWLGRFIFVIPVLALAGSLVKKKIVPSGEGTFPTDAPMFTGLLIGVIIIVGALTFFPALALGPILEHLELIHGHLH